MSPCSPGTDPIRETGLLPDLTFSWWFLPVNLGSRPLLWVLGRCSGHRVHPVKQNTESQLSSVWKDLLWDQFPEASSCAPAVWRRFPVDLCLFCFFPVCSSAFHQTNKPQLETRGCLSFLCHIQINFSGSVSALRVRQHQVRLSCQQTGNKYSDVVLK